MNLNNYKDQMLDVSSYKDFKSAKQAAIDKFKDNPEFSQALENPKSLKYVYVLSIDGTPYTVGKNESSSDRGQVLFADAFQFVHNKYPVNRLAMLNAKDGGSKIVKTIVVPKNSDIQKVNKDKLDAFEQQIQKDTGFSGSGKGTNQEILQDLIYDRIKVLRGHVGNGVVEEFLPSKDIEQIISTIGGLAYTEIDNLRANIITEPDPKIKARKSEGFALLFGYKVGSNKLQKGKRTMFKPGDTDNVDIQKMPKQLSLFEIIRSII